MNSQFSSNSNNKGIYIFFIILLLIISLGLGGYIIYTSFFVEEEITINETGEVLEQIQIDSDAILKVGETINTLERAFNDYSSSLFGYIYNSKEIDVEKFDMNSALYASIYDDLEESNNVSYVSNNTVRTRFKKMFGDQLIYTAGNINAGEGFNIAYDGIYYNYNRVGEGGYFHPEFVTFYDSSTISSEKIEVTKRVAYLEYSQGNTKIDMYTDSSKSKLISSFALVDGSYSNIELEAKYRSKCIKYKYTFTNDGNDNYILESIKRTS